MAKNVKLISVILVILSSCLCWWHFSSLVRYTVIDQQTDISQAPDDICKSDQCKYFRFNAV